MRYANLPNRLARCRLFSNCPTCGLLHSLGRTGTPICRFTTEEKKNVEMYPT